MAEAESRRGTRIAIMLGLIVIAAVQLILSMRAYQRLNLLKLEELPQALHTQAPEEEPVILFVGDLMFDRHIRRMARAYGEDRILSCAKPLFADADLIIGNLEGPITENASVSEGSVIGSSSNYRFTFSASVPALLSRYGIRLVNLGNNHIGDFGPEGLASTRSYLDAADVAHFGGIAGDEPVYRTEIKGQPLSFVSYNQFGGGSPESVAATIAKEHADGRAVIVYTHWGEEYVEPTPRMRETARLFVGSGATLVIGSHPHVVQESERIGSALVYYSLGNFVFDQYWDDQVSTGLAVRIRLTEDGPEATETRVRMYPDGRTCPI